MNKPKHVKVNDKLYAINTDFRVAIRVEEILRDDTIGEYEKFLAIIYVLFGDSGLDCQDTYKLFEKRH